MDQLDQKDRSPFRSLFPVPPHPKKGELIYLNSGTHSICPIEVTQSVSEALQFIEKNPSANLFASWAKLWEVQTRLGEFFHARADDIFLRSSVTAALSEFILGCPLPSNGEILSTDLEYGATANICRYRAEKSGLSLRQLHLPSDATQVQQLTEETLLEMIVRELRPETRMLQVSHVSTGNGLRLPLASIARETRKRGILFVVDGAHAPGSVPVDFRQLGDVDFYGGSLHKWMMAPKGTSFGWVPERNQNTLEPRQPGWTTYELPRAFKEYGGGNHAFAARFLISTSLDFSPFMGILKTLDFWKHWGVETIQSRLRLLQSAVIEEMSKNGPKWPLVSPRDPALRGPLVSYELPAPLQPKGLDLQQQLLDQYQLQVAITFVQGRWLLRLSPHIYNDHEEIVRAVKVLAELA